ncbi:flap endonuclease [Candidatus Phytoplasma ziziphi]|uniref:5'-3' exonuclease n=1 Tax=Ziziphus jujuba witches'-broom phytoplasma TaxID=135727 RepID=A0A660HMK7_ZIZJU|nr:5'-3' exonuclease H3TH domain-containing protein [Candidatus Phytoplasma ziziphi]AYJ01281.1 flap endonuclease [Candidatus Phytoplasma ziziphi]
MRKLVLVDGNSLVFRAYYATYYKQQKLMQNKEGQDVNALIVFINMFRKILEQTEDYICVAFDSKHKTYRHKLYEGYKQSRVKTPESLIHQIPLIKEYLTLSGIHHCSQDGYEADDIIGTIAKQAGRNNISVLIFSSDKDLLQLVDSNITVCLIKQGLKNVIYYDFQTLEKEFGLSPNQIIDFKSITGDNSDNIKGVPSIGPKTALKLLDQFDNLENIFDNLNNLNLKIKSKLIQFKKEVFLNRHLVTINKLVPLSFDYTQTQIQKKPFSVLQNFLQKYKLKQN